MTTLHAELLVAGAGPAGLLAAAACAEAGVDTVLVAPDPGAPWPARYGAWCDELAPLGLSEVCAPAWPAAEVRLDAARVHRLARPYARLDGDRLQARLLERLRAAGGRVVDAGVDALEPTAEGHRARLADGTPALARAAVDATGHRPRFVRRVGPEATAFQTAYGVLAALDRPWGDADAMVLMDWSDPGPSAPPLPGDTPSFLYAMPMPDGRWFLEETVLVQRPPVPIAALEARLHARLAARGVAITRVDEVERCVIPMDAPRPWPRQRVVGFGGAGSMVHPATGYLVGRCAALAPRLAAALRAALDATPDPDAVAAAAWEAAWPAPDRRCDALYRFGAEIAMTFDAAATRDFFDAFFRLPPADWSAYLSRTFDPPALRRAMTGFYRLLPPPLRRELRRGAFRFPGHLARGLLGLGEGRPDAPGEAPAPA